jgi:hypothetical protein
MAEKQEPRDQTIVVWKQTGDPRQDFVDRTIYLLLMSSGLQFKDPISLPPSQGRRREVVESQYHQSSLVEKTNFPGVLALVEESVFEPRGPKKQEELLGRTISLQLFSHGEWNKIQAKSTE